MTNETKRQVFTLRKAISILKAKAESLTNEAFKVLHTDGVLSDQFDAMLIAATMMEQGAKKLQVKIDELSKEES